LTRGARGESAPLATYKSMTAAIDALDLPIQFLAVGSAVGMMAALIRRRQTGETDHWPVYVAICSLLSFALGILISAIEALS
jgi:cytochrome c oxidase assembly factor CtaG